MAVSLLKITFHLLHLFPVRLLGALGAGIGRLGFYLLAKHRRITLRNIKRAYPQHSNAWQQRIARESFAELGRSMLELPYVFLGTREALLACVHVEGAEELAHTMRHQGVVLAAAHHSNWELGGLMASILIEPFAMIYRPMKNDGMDQFLKKCRERFGMKTYSRFEGIRWLPRMLRDRGCVAIMVDQHMSQGMKIPFMGHLACTTTLPAMFALRQQTPIYSISLHRIGHEFRFKLSIQAIDLPPPTKKREHDQYRIMEAVGKQIAHIIDERPELWLWLHKRWWILEHNPDAMQS
ncbi:MAG: lauroyl acyltransferase [Mariprofundaceae bacterium]|nr:lauroyl acyltransferase [Mariprofundaceae bacterium]